MDRWVFKHNGSCFVTNETTEKLITVIPPRGLTAVVEIPNDARLPADVQALVVAWTEGDVVKGRPDVKGHPPELYAVDDHVSAHDYAYPNLVSM